MTSENNFHIGNRAQAKLLLKGNSSRSRLVNIKCKQRFFYNPGCNADFVHFKNTTFLFENEGTVGNEKVREEGIYNEGA
jgi:hypothetical protein